MVNVKIRELTERKASLFIEDANPYFVNSLRRVLLSEVPKMAIEDAILYDNNSGLFDEAISHRLGLLPVPTDLGLFNFRDQCTCSGQGCPNCTIRYTLSKEGPAMVLSKDLQPENPAFAIADPGVPIVELLKGQRLILEAEAVLGRGRDHAKWQPCSGVGYRYVPILPKSPQTTELLTAAAKQSPTDAHRVGKGKEDLFDADGILALSDAALEIARQMGLSVRWDETRFLFKFETDGSLTAKAALLKAVDILKNRLTEFEEKALQLKVLEAEAA